MVLTDQIISRKALAIIILLYITLILLWYFDEKYHFLYQPKPAPICKIAEISNIKGLWCLEYEDDY